MAKKIIIFLFCHLVFVQAVLAESTVKEIGKGIELGGYLSGANRIGAIGTLISIIGSWTGGGPRKAEVRPILPGTEEDFLRRRVICDKAVKMEMHRQVAGGLADVSDVKSELIQKQAISLCSELEGAVQNKNWIQLDKLFFSKMIANDVFTPDEDGIMRYQLKDNPYNSTDQCVKDLAAYGRRTVALKRREQQQPAGASLP